MSTITELAAQPANTADMLRQFVALPRARQLTFMCYCLEAYAAGVTTDGRVLQSLCSDMSAMDEAWARKARRNTRRRMRPNLSVARNLDNGPDEPEAECEAQP